MTDTVPFTKENIIDAAFKQFKLTISENDPILELFILYHLTLDKTIDALSQRIQKTDLTHQVLVEELKNNIIGLAKIAAKEIIGGTVDNIIVDGDKVNKAFVVTVAKQQEKFEKMFKDERKLIVAKIDKQQWSGGPNNFQIYLSFAMFIVSTGLAGVVLFKCLY